MAQTRTYHFNQLTAAEHERLSLLLEEMGEVQHAIGKIMRHGYFSENPNTGESNKRFLEHELADVLFSIEILKYYQDVSSSNINEHMLKKEGRVQKFLHHFKIPKRK